MSGNDALTGRRVLVVEDEPMIAMLAEDMLADLGCAVVGPAHDLHAAMVLAASAATIDVALLDVNLAGKPVFALADLLRTKDVPMIFATGYGEDGLREADASVPVLQKPYRTTDLARALAQALAGATPRREPAP